jgi:O-antigen ligase
MASIAYACIWFFSFTIPWESSVMIPGLGSGPTGSGTIGKLVGLVTAAMGVLAILARGRARKLALFHILAACFVIWVGVTSTWSLDPEGSVRTFKLVVQVAAIPWLIWELAPDPKRRKGLFQAYVFGAYISVINILINYHSGLATRGTGGEMTAVDTGRYSAEGFNPNDLGLLLVLALPMAWQLSFDHRHTILRWINRLYIPLGTVAVLLTGSRSSMIGAVMALTLIPLTLGRLSHPMKVGVITLILATVVAGVAVLPEKTLARLSTTTSEIESGTLNERRVIWQAGLQLFWRRPIQGVGAGAFPEAVEPFLGYKKTAHNTYIDILIEEGAVGLILWVLILASIFFHARSAPPEERRFVFVVLATLVVGCIPRAWEYQKAMWLMFGFLLVPAASAVVALREPWADYVSPTRPLVRQRTPPLPSRRVTQR